MQIKFVFYLFFVIRENIAMRNEMFKDDCYTVGTNGLINYSGKINKTKYGTLCQRWDKSKPHKPYYPLGPEHANYCRNPDNDVGGLWCYTTNRRVRWQYCYVPKCVKHRFPPIIPKSPKTSTNVGTSSLGTVSMQTTSGTINVTNATTVETHHMNSEDNVKTSTAGAGKPIETFVLSGLAVLVVVIALTALIKRRKIITVVSSCPKNGKSSRRTEKVQPSTNNPSATTMDLQPVTNVPVYAEVNKRQKENKIHKNKTERFSIMSDEYSHTSFVSTLENTENKHYGVLRYTDPTDGLYDVGNSSDVRMNTEEDNYDHFVNQTDSDYENIERAAKWKQQNNDIS